MKRNGKKFIIVILFISMFICYIPKINAEEINLNDDNTIYFEDVVNAGHDTGYSKENDIKKDDPHYGWTLGKFAVSGFSGKSKDENGNVTVL